MRADEKKPSSIAILTYDRKSNISVIAREFVKLELDMPIQPLDARTKPRRTWRPRPKVDGYVDLDWCFHGTGAMYSTRFFVTSAHEPPFEAILGNPDAKRLNIQKTLSEQ